MILDPEYIKAQDLDTAKQLLKKCLANPNIELDLTTNPQLLNQADDLANTICYLEDHIHYLELCISMEKANAARWAKT